MAEYHARRRDEGVLSGIDWGKAIVVGMIAGAVMGMITMMWEWLFEGGFWSPLVYIAAVFMRDLQDVGQAPGFLPVPVLLGLVLHMMNSFILAAVFLLAARAWIDSKAVAIGAGIVYALLVFVVMWYVVLPLIDPVMLQLSAIGFAMAHVAYGAIIGWGASRQLS